MKNGLIIKVEKILWEEWDPIGVKDYGGLEAEYHVKEKADETKIAKLFHEFANTNMGLSAELTDHIIIARKLRSLN